MWVRISVVCLMLGVGLAAADSIRVGNTVYENVYVTKGTTMYYVSFPENGDTLNVNIADVVPGSVVITQDKDARQRLFDQWSQKRQASSNLPEPVIGKDSDIAVKESTPETNSPSSASKSEDKKDTPLSLSSSGTTEAAYDAYREQQMQRIRQRNAAAAQQRRQYETNKIRRLNAVRVIKSTDVGTSGSSYGSSMGSGYGNGYHPR